MSDDAPAAAWRAYDADPAGQAQKARLADLLNDKPSRVPDDRAEALLALITDPTIGPDQIGTAAWVYLWRDAGLFAGDADAVAARLEQNRLALASLRETFVTFREAEIALTQVRRRLLLGDRWAEFPKLSEALRAQAALNGGAWPFAEDERAALTTQEAKAAYLPERPQQPAPADFDDAVTRAVAGQYEAWPYPQWTRITRHPAASIAAAMRRRDPDGPPLADPADILVAGCGTGRQAVLLASQCPNDRLTCIDISAASLAYARERCAALGLGGIAFHKLDLHDVAQLGKRFDAVMCAGVLHHLPDPEAGWAALEAVLKPGGVMRILVYSAAARLRLRALRRHLDDLLRGPMNDDVLREARRRVLALPEAAIPASEDFFTLAGVHDLLLHRHEDPFDVPRIRRALERLDLRLIRFDILNPEVAAEYRAARADDPLRRDFEGWASLERGRPTLHARMYAFWCRKPA